MKQLTIILAAAALATAALLTAGAAMADPPIPVCDPADERVFADVTADNLFCPFIEELWRRGGTVGCRTDEDGTRWYCPNEGPNRGQFAAIAVRAWTPSPGATCSVVSMTDQGNTFDVLLRCDAGTAEQKAGTEAPLSGDEECPEGSDCYYQPIND